MKIVISRDGSAISIILSEIENDPGTNTETLIVLPLNEIEGKDDADVRAYVQRQIDLRLAEIVDGRTLEVRTDAEVKRLRRLFK